jgi:hypothetical protein
MAQASSEKTRVVVVHSGHPHDTHECATHTEAARRLAALLGYEFGGFFDAACNYDAPLYFVPSDTLVPLESAHRLGIRGEHDLFGGVVPHPYVATKTITHALASDTAAGPPGWAPWFAQRVADVVLPGYSAFTLADALAAGNRLLEQGAVRIKLAGGIGGLGQSVAQSAAELEQQLRALADAQDLRDGVVLECNLVRLETHSVGQVRVGAYTASYHGTQRLTKNNSDEEVYGGSDLLVVRGDFDALLAFELDDRMKTAIAQARAYHAAALASFPGMFASRCNYDIAQGVDDAGRWHSGVLEQSWRIGGASGAEIEALAAFRADPALRCVRASTTERYGTQASAPAGAALYYRGIDARVGPLLKYAKVETDAHP